MARLRRRSKSDDPPTTTVRTPPIRLDWPVIRQASSYHRPASPRSSSRSSPVAPMSALRKALPAAVRELRIFGCQQSPSSEGVRYVLARSIAKPCLRGEVC